MPRQTRATRIGPVVAALLTAALSTALAQQQVGDGRMLDRNMQLGAGQYIPPSAQPNYAGHNALITGNVAGFDYFRGRAGYRAPGEFRGGLSDDALFRFRAQSLGGPHTTVAPGVSLDPGLLRPGSVSVYRSLAPAGQPGLITPSAAVNLAAPSGLRVGAPPGASTTGTGLAPADTLTGVPAGGAEAGDGAAQGANLLAATPLMGLRSISAQHRAVMALGLPPSGDSLADLTRAAADVATQARVEGRPGAAAGTAERPADPSVREPRWPAGMVLGAQVQAALHGSRVESQQTIDERVAQLQAALLGPLGSSQAEPGQDVYMDILRRLRASVEAVRGQSPAADVTAPPTAAATSIQPAADAAGRDRGEAQALAGPPDVFDAPHPLAPQREPVRLDAPGAEQLQQARAQRQEAMGRARGLPASDAAAGAQTPQGRDATALLPDASPPGDAAPRRGPGVAEGAVARDGTPAELPASLNDLIDSLRYSGPGIASLAGRRQTLLDQLLRQAEDDLAAERYFDAEGKCRAAVELAPQQPMARIGLVHAQLGAGLIRSAAANLRQVLEQHPELVAVRYEARLLPPSQRLKWIREQLDQIVQHAPSAEPPVLLAYLGYQFRVPELVGYGLDLAQARTPEDPLLEVLRRLWLETDASGATGGASQGPPSVTPPTAGNGGGGGAPQP